MQTAVVHKVDHLALLDVLLHQGMTKYRPAGSKASLLEQVDTTNRNFRGRQGPGARTHLMSPAMVAAAAVSGHLADVRPMLQGRA